MGSITEIMNLLPEHRIIVIQLLTEDILATMAYSTWDDFIRPFHLSYEHMLLTFNDLKVNEIIAKDVDTALFCHERWYDLNLQFDPQVLMRFLSRFDETNFDQIGQIEVTGDITWPRGRTVDFGVDEVQDWMKDDNDRNLTTNLGWLVRKFARGLRALKLTVYITLNDRGEIRDGLRAALVTHYRSKLGAFQERAVVSVISVN